MLYIFLFHSNVHTFNSTTFIDLTPEVSLYFAYGNRENSLPYYVQR